MAVATIWRVAPIATQGVSGVTAIDDSVEFPKRSQLERNSVVDKSIEMDAWLAVRVFILSPLLQPRLSSFAYFQLSGLVRQCHRRCCGNRGRGGVRSRDGQWVSAGHSVRR